MATRVNPDQTPHYAASDLGLHCFQRPISPVIRVIKIFRRWPGLLPTSNSRILILLLVKVKFQLGYFRRAAIHDKAFRSSVTAKVVFVRALVVSYVYFSHCLFLISFSCLGKAVPHDYFPTDTRRLYNVASTSMQRHDVASTLRRRCVNVVCLLGIFTYVLEQFIRHVYCPTGPVLLT